LFLAFWYAQAGLIFLLLGMETKGRSIEQIDAQLMSGARHPESGAAVKAAAG
jgi:hypothetical protein